MKAVTPVPPANNTASRAASTTNSPYGSLTQPSLREQLALHPRRESPYGERDEEPIAVVWRARDREHARLRPEAARLIRVQREMQELPSQKARDFPMV